MAIIGPPRYELDERGNLVIYEGTVAPQFAPQRPVPASSQAPARGAFIPPDTPAGRATELRNAGQSPADIARAIFEEFGRSR